MFDRLASVAGVGPFRFQGSVADVNRFAARYRAAKCFRRVEFEGVTVDTADGYGALCQLLLTYSAFEHLLRSIGVEPRNTSTLLTDDERGRVLAHVRGLNGQAEIFTLLRRHVHPSYQRQIDSHLARRQCNPFYLAGSIRHAFAHGMLTATPASAPQRSVATVSRYLSRVLMLVMSREFEQRMLDFEHDIAPPNDDDS